MKLADIVVATDLSENATSAAKWAAAVAKETGANVKLAHIIEVSISSWFDAAHEILENQEALSAAVQKLNDWYQDATGELPDSVEIRSGSVLQQLTEIVEELDDDTILAVAKSGKGAVHQFLTGSTAQQIATQPPCPVAVIHDDHDSILAAKSIVVGTDFSANSGDALDFSSEFSALTHKPISVVHAVQPPHVASIFDAGITAPDHILTAISDKANEQMAELKGTFKNQDVDHQTMVIHDDPADGLMRVAKEIDADLIVVGHSGESEFIQNILGSVAQKVLKHTPCSLIIVPPSQ